MKQFIFFCLSMLLCFARLEAIPPDIAPIKHKSHTTQVDIAVQTVSFIAVAPVPTQDIILPAYLPIVSAIHSNQVALRCVYLHEPFYHSAFDKKNSCSNYEDFSDSYLQFIAEVSTKSRIRA